MRETLFKGMDPAVRKARESRSPSALVAILAWVASVGVVCTFAADGASGVDPEQRLRVVDDLVDPCPGFLLCITHRRSSTATRPRPSAHPSRQQAPATLTGIAGQRCDSSDRR